MFVTAYAFLASYQAYYLLDKIGSAQADVPQQIFLGTLAQSDNAAKDLGVFNIAGALPFSIVPAIAPAILALSGGSYGVLYAVAGLCAVIGAFAVLPVKGVR